jgi:hypothetical protein
MIYLMEKDLETLFEWNMVFACAFSLMRRGLSDELTVDFD